MMMKKRFASALIAAATVTQAEAVKVESKTGAKQFDFDLSSIEDFIDLQINSAPAPVAV